LSEGLVTCGRQIIAAAKRMPFQHHEFDDIEDDDDGDDDRIGRALADRSRAMRQLR
jgi:hypothetical protein